MIFGIALYNGTFERLAEREGYARKFKTDLIKRSINPNPQIEDPTLKQIYKYINYIPMSPRNKNHFINCFSLKDHRDNEVEQYGIGISLESGLLPLNHSLRRVNKFVKLIIKRARDIVKPSSDEDYKFCRFSIVGAPGVGKTALINYIFSVNYQKINRKQIIFIRVDLNDINVDATLEERFVSKWMRIFSQKYFRTTIIDDDKFEDEFFEYFFENFSEYGVFKNYKKNNPHKVDEIFWAYIKALHEIHDTEYSEKDFSLSDLEVKPVCQQYGITSEDFCIINSIAMNFMQNRLGWGFIIVLDGFDSVSFDQIQYEKYKIWCSELGRVTAIEGKRRLFRAVYIVTLRDYSYIRFLDNRKQEETDDMPNILKRYIRLKVEQQDVRDIINKRFLYLSKKIDLSNYDNLKRNMINLMYMCYEGCNAVDLRKKTLKSSCYVTFY
ncbi:hypothetical protein [uncultured Desulfobacter sp.]|uniref:hypothetical protein n=1 Tax=uncultured Desulfobacter sp. TaxID=240139 RepID=UPI00259BBF5E|nr:hypothetical protein [uncultured Desulfobacter sp.]